MHRDSSQVRLSIIIVNWNVRDFLRDCQDSIYRTVGEYEIEVFVVDNASVDGSVQMVQSEFPTVTLLINEQNLGFARANNRAIQEAAGDYILLLNPDTILWPGALDTMLDFMEVRPEVGAVGPYTVDAQGNIQRDCARAKVTLTSALWEMTFLYAIFPKSHLFGRHLMTWWDHEDTRPVDAVSGACIMLRRAVIDEVGMLDENFFLYGEDLDWCLRITNHGWQIYFVSEAKVTHFKNQSTRQVSDRQSLEYWRARRYYIKKHHGRLHVIAYGWIYLLGMLLRVIAWGGILLLVPKYRSIAKSKFVAVLSAIGTMFDLLQSN